HLVAVPIRLDRLAEREGLRGARQHALAAFHAARLPHRVVQVKPDPRVVALARAADDVVMLDVVAAPRAAVAEDAGAVVDRDEMRRFIAPPRRLAAGAIAVGIDRRLLALRRREESRHASEFALD